MLHVQQTFVGAFIVETSMKYLFVEMKCKLLYVEFLLPSVGTKVSNFGNLPALSKSELLIPITFVISRYTIDTIDNSLI